MQTKSAILLIVPFLALSAFAQAPASPSDQAQSPPSDQAQPSQPGPVQSIPATTPPPHEELRDYVGHFLIYAGGAEIDTPALGLSEQGFHLQAGMRWSRHISLGIDFSHVTGNNTIGLGLATTALQNEVNPLLANLKATGIIPQNYVAALPLSSTTSTLTAGPEFPYRRWNRITPYIRPSIGFIFENATALPPDFVTKLLVKSIAPTGMESQITEFYGVGGGCGFNLTKHFSLVVQGDVVHYHLFPSLLRNGTNAFRISVGPGVQFGKNVTTKWGIPVLHPE